ncbi:MAG: sigma 54-interacting transcriptional regulator [Deltaproteobacteria bacterium]|nr:sigma 54-interacting transcriptional regulator [Deltaproteobacteria bacterium]
MAPSERTLTAQLDSAAAANLADIPLLLLAGRAGAGRIEANERLLVLGKVLDVGRRPSGAAQVMPGALLLDDPLASSRHARFERRDDGWVLFDQGSKNGLFVGGERLLSARQLQDGDVITVGSHLFVFRLATQEQLVAIRKDLSSPLAPVPTTSPRLALQNDKLRRLANSDAEVLLVGETGVGKEIYARALHDASGRKGRFVALNCAAIPRELVESELFGYRAGAHSTASAGKPGLVEEADGGTLFLDEIGEMTRDAQTKVLRFLQDRELTPLGSTRPRRIDVRVVAATNRNVMPGSSDGLRDDLLGRLGAAPLWLPPLRDRREDIGPLAAFFLARETAKRGSGPAGFDAGALSSLVMAAFPLNVRQLEKTVGAAVALADPRDLIGVRHLPETLNAHLPVAAPITPLALRVPETRSGRKAPEPAPLREDVERLLGLHKGNVAEVARALGRQRAAVWRWIKQFGLNPESFR